MGQNRRHASHQGLDIPTIPRDLARVFRGVDGRDRDALGIERDQQGADLARITIAAEERIQGRVRAREDQTGQSLNPIIVEYATRLEAARGFFWV